MSEPELIKRCLKRDKKAWDLFVDKYAKLVYWAIRRRLALSKFEHNQADIEDIFQEVFLTILKSEKLLQSKGLKSLSGWIAMVASSRAVDFMRRKISRREDLSLDNLVFKEDFDRQGIFDRDTTGLIREVIGNLSDKERVIVSLSLIEGNTHKQIAQILNVPMNTVSTVIARAKDKLKKELHDRGIGENF